MVSGASEFNDTGAARSSSGSLNARTAAAAAALLRRNLLIYGLGGIVAPFPGIWVIDRLLGILNLA